MFPDVPGVQRRLKASLGDAARTRWFRILVAATLACLHLAMLDLAGHKRLHRPFNYSPDEPPAFKNPDAIVLGGYPREPQHWSRLIASRWDSQVYIGFALRGLKACPSKKAQPWRYMQCGLAWMPAFGMLGGNIADVFHLPADYTLLFIAVLAAIFVNFFWTSRTITDRIGLFEAYATLLAFNCYPSAFYMVAPYTESLTLALVFGGVWMMEKDRWVLASVLVGAASSLRATALAFSASFGLAILVTAWFRRREKRPDWWKPLLGIPLCAWGLIATFVMFKLWVGDALAYVHARQAFGDSKVFSRLLDPTWYLKGFTSQHMDSVMMFGMVALVALAGREALKKFPREIAVFLIAASVSGLLLVIPTVHEYWGINRYLLFFPIGFLAAGVTARRWPWLFVLWLVLCTWMYWHVELCSFVAHGNPNICPCLGRIEWMAPYGS